MKLILITALSLFSLTALAHDLSLRPYIEMQESLAQDNFKSALKAHETICKEMGHYKDQYKDCSKKFKDIKDLRNSFKTLSEVYMKNGKKEEMKGYMKATCPMAEANWIQKKGEIQNPYYGKSMLTCGEKL